MPASTILVLESPTTGDASLAPHLTSAGYTVTRTTDPDEAGSASTSLGSSTSGSSPAQAQGGKAHEGIEGSSARSRGRRGAPAQDGGTRREIRATPAMAAVPILCAASSSRSRNATGFLEAGADDVIARPFDARVEAAVEALLLRSSARRTSPPVISAMG